MRGAKPSSGLVHLHKSFVELHFPGRLPQNVSIVPCVDGTTLGTVLPGQVYATSYGQDHWLLGLQFIFKAYKQPVITHVEKTGDSQLTVAIATQGLQAKYTSDDPEQRAELQRSMETAAVKFAQAAVMRKAGRLQVSGPNINIPKKQLRAQWPAVLERLAPQEVTAHIFVDSTDAYIACAAKIILTKAKAEPVFYLSGLSQLLKSFMGAYVTIELMPSEQVVRLNIDTGNSRQASLSTTAAAAAGTASQVDQAEASSAAVQQPCATTKAAGGAPGERKRSRSSQSGDHCSGACVPATASATPAAAIPQTARAGKCAVATSEAAVAAGIVATDKSSPVLALQQALDKGRSPAATAAAVTSPHKQLTAIPQQQQQQHMLEGMGTSNVGVVRGDCSPCGAVQQIARSAAVFADNSECSSLRPPAASPGHMASLKLAAAQVEAAEPMSLAGLVTILTPVSTAPDAAASDGTAAMAAAETARSKSGAASSGITPGSDAGLWLLADHAVQLQAVGSSGNLSSAAAVAALPAAQQQRRQHSSGSRREAKAWPVSKDNGYLGTAEAPSPAGIAVASSNPVQLQSIPLDLAAAAAMAVNSAVLASAAMATAAVPAATGANCPGAAEGTAVLAHADNAGLARQRSAAGLTAAVVVASGQSKPALVSSAVGAAVPAEEEYPRVERWQMHPKRRRTAHAAEDRDRQQHQQDYHCVLPGHVLGTDMGHSMLGTDMGHSMLGTDMGHSMMFDSSAAAAGQYGRWGAGSVPARTDSGAHNVLQSDMHALPFQCWQHHGLFLEEQQCSQMQQQQQQMLASGAHLTSAATAPAFATAGTDVFVRHGDDVRALAQQHADQHGIGGAVAIVTRVGSDISLAAHKTQVQQQKLKALREAALATQHQPQQQPQLCLQRAAAQWHRATLPVESKACVRGPTAIDTAALQAVAPAAALGPVVVSNATGQPVSGLQPRGTPSDWSPAMQSHLGSPSSNTSSISRVPIRHGSAPNSTPGSCSPAMAAVQWDAAGGGAVSRGGGAGAAFAADACGTGCEAAQALQVPRSAAQQLVVPEREPNTAAAAPHGLRPPAGSIRQASGVEASRDQRQTQLTQKSPTSMHNQSMAAAVDTPGCQLVRAVLAAAAGVPDVMHNQHQQEQQQQQAMQIVPIDQAAALCADGWPILPDADSLLAVGKALVQVMNLLGAGSEARLVLTRALRIMSPLDREWLLSITYPHLQDSCRRRALSEMRMILNEVAGIECFADTSAPAADVAGRDMAAGLVDTGYTC